MVTIKFKVGSLLDEKVESSLIRFLAQNFLNGPRQRRAFLADSAPFDDTDHLVVIRQNYLGKRL